MKIINAEDKWDLVKTYYEASYFDPENSNLRFRFKSRPNPIQLEELYRKMLQHKETLKEFYTADPQLEHRLEHVRGHIGEVTKRGEFE